VTYGHRELGHRQRRQCEVLRELRTQLPRRVRLRAPLDEIERARIARRNAARLTENHLEQRVQVALGGEGDADARQLAQLAMTFGDIELRAPRRDERSGMPEGAAKRGDDRANRRVAGYECRQ